MQPQPIAPARALAPEPLTRAYPFTAIVAAHRARVGKTLLARALCDYLLLSGRDPQIFDTDAADRKLSGFFPRQSTVIDLDRLPDQMRLLEALTAVRKEAQVVDLAQKSSAKFFDLMRETGRCEEAALRGARTVVFYLPDGAKDAYEEAHRLRERFSQHPLVMIENELFGRAGAAARRNVAGSVIHQLPSVTMPNLDPDCVDLIEDQDWSLSGFMRRPLPLAEIAPACGQACSLAAKASIRAWTLAMFQEIHRIARLLQLRA